MKGLVKQMDGLDKHQLNEGLYFVLASLKTPEDVKMFFEDLCTFKEIEQMAQRVECAKLLLENNTYTQIIAKTDISSATLSRVSRCVQYGSGGYNKLLPKIIKENNGK
jgi:TrpR-related protein YerC/YecD